MVTPGIENVSALWAIASGVAVSLLGIYALAGRDTRPRGALPFGLFALVWGIQIAAINAASIVETAIIAEYLYLASLIALFPLAYFLTEFATSQTQARGRRLGWRIARIAAAGFALVAAGVFVLRPTLLFEGALAHSGVFYPSWGPAFYALVSFPFFIFFGLALIALRFATLRSPTARTRRLSSFLFVGLGIYASYTAGNQLVVNADLLWGSLLGAPWFTYAYSVLFLSLSALVIVLGIDAAKRWEEAPAPSERKTEGWTAVALLVPFAAGAFEHFLVFLGLPDFQLVGAWRLVGIGVITYGLVRRRLYDLPQRSRRAGATATGSAGALAAGGTAFGFGSVLTGTLLLPVLIGSATAVAAAGPAVRWARELFIPGDGEDLGDAEKLYEQKIETYRAALEDSMGRGTLEEDEPFLEGLRRDFGISDGEDRVLRHFAQKAIVPHREGSPEGAYERLRILGQGGAGRAWLARDRTRDRLVVLKEPLEQWHSEPSVMEAARREAQMIAKVRHRNVVDVHEVLEDDGRPVLVMEYIAGGSLADTLQREGTLEPDEVIQVGVHLASGLKAVHKAGIIHRDLKPANVLITEDGRAMIADFGLAQKAGSSGTQLLDDNAGTAGYQPPDAGQTIKDATYDVYSLAAILHTCLYGRPPMEGTVHVDEDVPRDLQRVLEKALRRNPDERFEDAQALEEALRGLIETGTVPAQLPSLTR